MNMSSRKARMFRQPAVAPRIHLRTIVFFSFLALCILVAWFALRHPEKVTVGDELVGTWKSDLPEYADRFFEIHADTIVLGVGNDKVSVQTISSVEREEHPGQTDYIIHTVAYDDENYRPEDRHETKWFVSYRNRDGGVIEFNHQPGFWKKISKDAPLLE